MKLHWERYGNYFVAEGSNESIYRALPGPPIKLEWATRTGTIILGEFKSLVAAKEAAEKHRS